MENTLYYGDNLDILREHIEDNSIDLIYLDPPFKSNQDYNILFKEKNGSKSVAQIKAFEDTWHWCREAEETYIEIAENLPKKVADLIRAFRSFLGENDMMAYLVMMAIRLQELHRVLKPTGSIYLHCDPTASHYLKLLMDAVFNYKNFCNEIIWHYRKWSAGKYIFQKNHDVLFFYSCSTAHKRTFNQLFMERAPSTLKRFGIAEIISGYDETGYRIPSRTSKQNSKGVRQDDVWDIGRVPPRL
jgi:site-specific DNA-methyltransferase (adenine-specific)